ncbi:MAG: polyamine ABC transporter substrate-binding protein [Alphaproteobacteria bacterium]|nr:polyamine ABC transporter substrate-binding protein [Alphaproteobacteria bacterium]
MRRFTIAAGAAAVAIAGLCAATPVAAQKTLNVAMGAADLGALDPHRTATTQDKAIIGWMFNGLVRIRPGSISPADIEPDIAERWESSPDQLTWKFFLRKGVRFHGGYGELTSDDVVFSLKRAADPKTSAFSSDFRAISDITALDPYTVEIKFREHIPSVLGILTNYQGGYIVSRKAVEALGDEFRSKAVGTGPFAYADYQRNQAVTLAAHKEYFRGAPRIDRIVYRYIPSDASRDLAFTSGELDLMFGRADQKWVERMRQTPDTQVLIFGPGELGAVHLNITKKPLDDVRVRQAVAHAINRAQIVKFRGESVFQAAVSIVPEGYLGTDEKAPLQPYDVAKAKKLLAEAGYKDGITLKAIQTSQPSMLSVMEVVQAQLKQAGINLQFEVVDHPTFHAQIRKDLSDVVYYSAARFPIADQHLTQFYHSRSTVGTPTAVTNFSHCGMADAEIDAARVATDPEKQKALWKEAQRKLIEAVCSVPLAGNTQVWAKRGKLDLGYDLKGSLSLGPLITEASTLR